MKAPSSSTLHLEEKLRRPDVQPFFRCVDVTCTTFTASSLYHKYMHGLSSNPKTANMTTIYDSFAWIIADDRRSEKLVAAHRNKCGTRRYQSPKKYQEAPENKGAETVSTHPSNKSAFFALPKLSSELNSTPCTVSNRTKEQHCPDRSDDQPGWEYAEGGAR